MMGALLQSCGLSGVGYVATIAANASAMHAARLVAYGIGGAVDGERLAQGLFAAIAVMAGNILGDRLRRWMGDLAQRRCQQVAMFATLSLAIASLGLG